MTSFKDLCKQIWLDGKWLSSSEANIHVFVHSLHYGTAVWEGLRAYETKKGLAIFRLHDHTIRLFNSAKIIGMNIPYSFDELINIQIECVKRNQPQKGVYIRPIAFYSADSLGVRTINKNLSVHVMVSAFSWEHYLSKEAQEKGIRIGVSSYARPSPKSNLCKAKASGNYINSVLSTNEAHLQGYDEALLLDQQGFVAEGSGQNFFMIKNGELHTPDLSSILDGITRDTVLKIAQNLGILIKERTITRDETYIADEAFFTGTAVEITPICEIDKRKIGNGKPGAITRKLQEEFFSITQDKKSNIDTSWLTYVK